jgi:hypothetical protein
MLKSRWPTTPNETPLIVGTAKIIDDKYAIKMNRLTLED